jgi:cytochrome c5
MLRTAALTLLLLPAVALAEEGEVRLKDAPGRDLVVASCNACHSLDYIPMNSPVLDRKGWEGSVNKMVKVMGAPLTPDEAKQVVDYLVAAYGKR